MHESGGVGHPANFLGVHMSIDLSPLLVSFTAPAVLIPVLSVVGILAAIVFSLLAAAFVLALIRGDWSNPDYVEFRIPSFGDSKEADFERRYRREKRSQEYRQWKKSRGY